MLVSSVLFISCNEDKKASFTLPYYNEPTFTPIFEDDKSLIEKAVTHKIDDFSFLNQDSILINQDIIEGNIHVANFIFTSCGNICPTMTRNLKTVSDSLVDNKKVILISYSVTPWIDKPHILKRYKRGNNIKDKKWHFLTGKKADIYKLARTSYFAEEDIGFSKDSTEFLHTEHFILVDKNKRIRGIYNGTLRLEMQHLLSDIRILESEK